MAKYKSVVLLALIAIALSGCSGTEDPPIADHYLTVTGRIYDSISQAPLVGARLTFGDTTNFTGDTSGVNGEYQFTFPEALRDKVYALKDGYYTKLKSVADGSYGSNYLVVNFDFPLAPVPETE